MPSHLNAKYATRAWAQWFLHISAKGYHNWIESALSLSHLPRFAGILNSFYNLKWQLLIAALLLGACHLYERFVRVSHNHILFFLSLKVAAKVFSVHVCVLVSMCVCMQQMLLHESSFFTGIVAVVCVLQSADHLHMWDPASRGWSLALCIPLRSHTTPSTNQSPPAFSLDQARTLHITVSSFLQFLFL